MTTLIARKKFSVFEVAYHPGDVCDLAVLRRIPGGYEKMIRNGFITEERTDGN